MHIAGVDDLVYMFAGVYVFTDYVFQVPNISGTVMYIYIYEKKSLRRNYSVAEVESMME